MKRLLLAIGLLIGAVLLPQQASARPDINATTKELPTFRYRPLVLEKFPIDLSAFNNLSSTDDGPFDFARFGNYRPFTYAFGEERGGDLIAESNYTFYGLDTATPVYAGITGTVFHIQRNYSPECDWEILISPDSPVNPLSFSIYFDHIMPAEWLIEAFEGNNPVWVQPNDVIGTVGIRNDGGCSTENAGWLEIGIGQNYPYTWFDMQNPSPTMYAAFCPALFMPTSTAAPVMPQRPTLASLSKQKLWPYAKKPDTTAPKLIARQPANGKRGVTKDLQSITFSFNERVTVTMRDDARVSLTRLAPGAPNVTSVSGLDGAIKLSNKGKKVTVDISSMNLENGAMYAIKISDFLFRDVAGNAFQGINGLGDWTFIVGPTTVKPAPTSFTAIRSTVESQIRNIMRKYNRDATETSAYQAYTDDQINRTIAHCMANSFSADIVQQGG